MSNSSRARQPIKGLRQQLRAAVRATGFDGKFSTDLRRDGCLLISVKGSTPLVLPFSEFEGHRIAICNSSVSS